jgi:membrane protein required for beta-lactamase induction
VAVTLALIGRFSKALRTLRKAVGHLSSKILQMRRRSTTGLDVGAACVRARRKKKAVVRWMNCMAVVGKNLS